MNNIINELKQLGWVFDDMSEEEWYMFKREDETLTIDFDKKKITHDISEEDCLNELSFETIYLILELVKQRAIY